MTTTPDLGPLAAAGPALEAYAAFLATAGIERGLLGPREVPRLWERHLLNCAGLAELVPPDASVVDIGSGAGLPGIVLAAVRPDVTVTLLEPLLRRATFLEEAVAAIGLSNAVVERGRAEDVAGRREYDVATARAVAPLERLVGWALPLVRVGGVLLALKGSSAAEEVAVAGRAVDRAGGGKPEVRTVGDADVGTLATVVVVPKLARPAASTARSPRTKHRRGTAR